MNQHVRSFFGQKSALFFDSGSWEQENIYITVIKKKSNGIWEKPSENEGKKIKLNLGELIMVRRVFMGIENRWSTVHKFNDIQTRISINADTNNSEQIWFNIEDYHKSLQPPETEIFLLLLAHIIDEKITHATGRKQNYGANQSYTTRKTVLNKTNTQNQRAKPEESPKRHSNTRIPKKQDKEVKREKYFCKTYSR